MKTSFMIATCVVGSLYGGHSDYAWSGDLDAALENINIRSDAENAPKKIEKNNLPCTKVSDVNCASSQDELNATAYGATSAMREAIVGDSIPRVTINGVSVGTINQQSTATVGGF
jgi:hypothetical protein